ncbi:class I SAM-dependent methyltransferase [Micrococcus luteus]|uniref:SAM-dependent methyltransferase n=1 Tax=Micrococcus luteus TaxID=1270 RepID=UPI000C9A306D|nr:SAM-dependent methyltransferase [Micrococcus luteus]MCV7699496.1 class I SAM-dependent methyltransferase [Micrococcus luteus]MCV7712838.1 class I SAM-dependent methyltransferase [Micrococcus luteus]PMC35201.1 SAM-dependent methyltransferase [Micrococcus luteus]
MVEKARRLRARTTPGPVPTRGPQGHITRGTTAAQRMRRVDRWLTDVHGPLLRRTPRPLAVDLGFGAEPVTAVEMAERLRVQNPALELVGLEIDPARVARARERAGGLPGVTWAVGGFELPVPRPPTVVRAFNVLRQYREEDVPAIWSLLCAGLADDGVLVEGTCSEDGRRAAWVDLRRDGPASLTVALRLGSFARPSDVAARLPKVLIHRHVPGEPVHRLLAEADAAWAAHAPLAAYGTRQRWLATVGTLRAAGWPVLGGPHQWRRGELSVRWAAVAPSP